LKLRLTPLNIVSALSIMAVFTLLLDKKQLLKPVNEEYKGVIIAMCLLVLFVSFLSDQIFRKFIPSLARLWLIQLAMIFLTVILVAILKVSIFK
jgi:hypothetical protein